MKQYKEGDYLVHEGSGVCQVLDITSRDFAGNGSEELYYTLVPVFQSGSQIITPVGGGKVRIRDVRPAAEMKELLTKIPSLDIIEAANDRALAESFKEHINMFEPLELARVLKTVSFRTQKRILSGKKVMSADEKVSAIAGKKLFEEMAFSMNTTVAEVKSSFDAAIPQLQSC